MAKDGTVTVKITGDAKGLKDALDDSDGHLSGFDSKMGGVAQGIGKAFVGMGAAAGAFGVLSVKAFMDSQQVASQTAAVLKSTGGAAKVTGDHVSGLAGQLSMLSGVDDEVVQSGENVLLTFTNVKNAAGKNNDIFDQATKSALDMSVALGTDLNGANIQLGKALNDPIKGITALSKVGVSFTAQQKDQIKTLVAHGNTLGAQKIILKELSTEFGGSAKAAGETFAGAINKLKVQVGNFMEDVGARLVPILMRFGTIMGDVIPAALAAVAPFFQTLKLGALALFGAFEHGQSAAGGFSGAMSSIGVKLREIWNFIQANVVPVFGQFADLIKGNVGPTLAALGALIAVIVVPPFVAWAIATVTALAPIIAITVAIAALAAGLVYAYQHFEGFREAVGKVKEVVAAAFDAIRAVVETVVKILVDLWHRFGSDILSFAKEAFNGIVEVVRGVFEIVKGVFDVFAGLFTGDWGRMWDGLKGILTGAWDAIVGYIRFVIFGLADFLIQAGSGVLSAAWSFIWNSLKTLFTDLWVGISTGVSNALTGIVDFFTDLPARLVSAAGDLYGFVRDKITDARIWVHDRIWDVIGYFQDLPANLAAGAGDIFGFVKTKITDARIWVHDRIGDVIGYFEDLPGRLKTAGAGMFDGIKDAFFGAINWIIDKWNDFHLSLPSIDWGPLHLGGQTLGMPHLNHIALATGGIVTKPTMALIGEAGPEAVIPLSRFGGGAGTIVNYYYSVVANTLDPVVAAPLVITAIQEYERRNGQGWRT